MDHKKRTKFADQIIRRRKRKFALGTAALVVFLVFCYLFVWERVYTLRLAEANAQTRQRVNYLKERAQSLEFEINQLSSVRRIEDIARRDLALLPAREAQLVGFTVSAGGGTAADSGIARSGDQYKALTSTAPTKTNKPPDGAKKQKASKTKTSGQIAALKPKTQK